MPFPFYTIYLHSAFGNWCQLQFFFFFLSIWYSMRYAPNLCKMQLHKNTWKNNELNSSPVSCVYYLSENVIVSLVSVGITQWEYILYGEQERKRRRRKNWKERERESQRNVELTWHRYHTDTPWWRWYSTLKLFFCRQFRMRCNQFVTSRCCCYWTIFFVSSCSLRWLSGTAINYHKFIFSKIPFSFVIFPTTKLYIIFIKWKSDHRQFTIYQIALNDQQPNPIFYKYTQTKYTIMKAKEKWAA